MPLVRARIRIFGRVQGVFFRESLRRIALANNVRGWVRNLPDGSVEAVLQGEEGAVRKVIRWARRGPPLARVTHMNIVWEEVDEEEFETFEIRY